MTARCAPLPRSAYRRYRLFQVIGERSFKVFPIAGARVTKTELPCVQHLARKILSEPRCVDFVAQHRIAKMMQMYSNLMSATTVQFALNDARLLGGAKNAIFSLGRTTAW